MDWGMRTISFAGMLHYKYSVYYVHIFYEKTRTFHVCEVSKPLCALSYAEGLIKAYQVPNTGILSLEQCNYGSSSSRTYPRASFYC